MSTIDIDLPETLKSYLDEEVARRGYRDASEFVQALLEAERLRDIREELEHSLRETLDQPTTPLTDQDFEDVQRQGTSLIEKRRQRQ